MNTTGIPKYLGVFVILSMTMLTSAVAKAQGPSGIYATGITCLNLETRNAYAEVVFYKSNGGKAATVSRSNLKSNSPWLLFTPNLRDMPSVGSAVVKADREVACSVNTQTNSGTQRVGTSQGQSPSDVGPKLFATQIVNNAGGFDSYVAVQNVGSSAVDVKATYFDKNGRQKSTRTSRIAANASKIFYQSQADLGNGFVGSATFESTDGATKLAGTVALYKDGIGVENAQFLSFNTFTKGAPKVFAPRLVKNLSGVGYTSGWACQNLGPGNANMKMTITMFDQDRKSTKSATLRKNGVAEGQAWGGHMGRVGNSTLDHIRKGIGSAVIESSRGKIACTFNEDNKTNYAGQGSTYGGVPDGERSRTIFFPQIVALGANSFRGGFQYANTTGSKTTCTHRYSNGDVRSNVELKANESNSIFAEADLKRNKTSFNGSVEVTCGQPIVGIYNLTILSEQAVGLGDPYATNNGINR